MSYIASVHPWLYSIAVEVAWINSVVSPVDSVGVTSYFRKKLEGLRITIKCPSVLYSNPSYSRFTDDTEQGCVPYVVEAPIVFLHVAVKTRYIMYYCF